MRNGDEGYDMMRQASKIFLFVFVCGKYGGIYIETFDISHLYFTTFRR